MIAYELLSVKQIHASNILCRITFQLEEFLINSRKKVGSRPNIILLTLVPEIFQF